MAHTPEQARKKAEAISDARRYNTLRQTPGKPEGYESTPAYDREVIANQKAREDSYKKSTFEKVLFATHDFIATGMKGSKK